MAIIHALATWPAIEWRAPANSAAWPSALARAARLPARTRPHRSSSHWAPRVKLWRSLRKEEGILGIVTPNCAMFSLLADKPPLRPIWGNCSAPAIFACAQAASSRAAALQTSGLASRACPIASLNRASRKLCHQNAGAWPVLPLGAAQSPGSSLAKSRAVRLESVAQPASRRTAAVMKGVRRITSFCVGAWAG